MGGGCRSRIIEARLSAQFILLIVACVATAGLFFFGRGGPETSNANNQRNLQSIAAFADPKTVTQRQRVPPQFDAFSLWQNHDIGPSALSMQASFSSGPPYVARYPGPTATYAPKELPCFPGETAMEKVQAKPVKRGFIYLKPFKCASTTLKGVAIQISRNVGRRRGAKGGRCLARWDHGWAVKRQYQKLMRAETFLWTMLREPTRRYVSAFFFQAGRGNMRISDGKFRKEINRGDANFYFHLLSLDETSWNAPAADDRTKTISDILELYDFIGITERMNESLVVLKLLLGLEYNDILYLSSKRSGGCMPNREPGSCMCVQKSFVSDGMNKYFESEEWQRKIFWDNAVYAAACRSLDRTIDALGREVVMDQLAEFERRLAIATEVCEGDTIFPCNSEGVFSEETSCLDSDAGCGYDCYNSLSYD